MRAALDCRLARCGDGILRTDLSDTDPDYEECDDGDLNNGNECTNQCKVARCGDGIVQSDVEACDNGLGIDTVDCTRLCQLPVCGDGIVSVGEECDDGNTIDSDGCRNDCLNARCGDGVIRTDVGTEDPPLKCVMTEIRVILTIVRAHVERQNVVTGICI